MRDISLNKEGKGSVAIEREMLLSCEPGSLRVVSVLPLGRPALATASVAFLPGQKAKVECIAKALNGRKNPHGCRVRIEGVRLGHPEQWPRFSEDQAHANDEFWGLAHGINVA